MNAQSLAVSSATILSAAASGFSLWFLKWKLLNNKHRTFVRLERMGVKSQKNQFETPNFSLLIAYQ